MKASLKRFGFFLAALLAFLLLGMPAAAQQAITTGARCANGRDCEIGSDNVTDFYFRSDGDFSFRSGSTGAIDVCFRDYGDTTDDDMCHAIITANCTTTSTGAEDCDMTFGVVEAGAAADVRLTIDADGGIDFGSATNTDFSVTTATSSMDLEQTTANTLTVTAATTGTAIIQGADAAGASNTLLDTTGAGTVGTGSADVTSTTLTTDGLVVGIDTALNTLTLTAATTGTVTILGADAAGASNLLIDTTGAGDIAFGSADVTGHTFTSDGFGGVVVIDGSVLAQVPAAAVASGAIAINSVTLATAAADYDIPDGACNAAADVGNWVTIVAEDDTTLISITSDDASNVFNVPGLDIAAGNELDNVTEAAHEGQTITLTCLAADQWYMTAGTLTNGTGAAIAWADGGTAD